MKTTRALFLIGFLMLCTGSGAERNEDVVDYDPVAEEDSEDEVDEVTTTTLSPEESSWWVTEPPEPNGGMVFIPANGTHPGSTAVIGGKTVHPANKYPFMVSLMTRDGVHICGGSLIGRKSILTAAHCVVSNGQPVSPDTLQAGIGLHSLAKRKRSNMFAIERIAVHPAHSANNVANDIAVVILNRKAPASARPIRLPASIRNNPKPLTTWLKATGWGLTRNDDKSSAPRVLQEADFKVMLQSMCRARLGSVVTGKQICVFNDRVATCSGDSGGPLFEEIDSEKSVLFGIVSFGLQKGCKSAGNANVFTRVSRYLPWIQNFNLTEAGF